MDNGLRKVKEARSDIFLSLLRVTVDGGKGREEGKTELRGR